jgi:hypothetical protein
MEEGGGMGGVRLRQGKVVDARGCGKRGGGEGKRSAGPDTAPAPTAAGAGAAKRRPPSPSSLYSFTP